MRKLLLLCAFGCCSVIMFAQQNKEKVQYDPFLYEVLSPERFAEYQQNEPSKLLDINYDLIGFCYIDNKVPDNSLIIGDICEVVSPGQVCDAAQQLVDSKRINRRKYALSQDEYGYTLYSIGSTGYYVIVYPQSVFVKNKAAYMQKYAK